jgi:hypothetical protein
MTRKISADDVLRMIADEAGVELSESEIDAKFFEVLAKNRQSIASGKDVPEIVVSENNGGPISTLSVGQGTYTERPDLGDSDGFNYSVDPTDRSAIGAKMLSHGLSGFTSGRLNMAGDDAAPNGDLETFLTSAASGAGMAGQMGLYAPLLAPLAAAPIIGAPLSGAAGMAAYEGFRPVSNMQERVGNIKHGAVLGGALGAAGVMPGVRQLTSNALGRYLYDTSLMTGMNVHGGMGFKDALVSGAGMAAGMGAAHGMGFADPRRSVAEQEYRRITERAQAEQARVDAERAQADAAARERDSLPREYDRSVEELLWRDRADRGEGDTGPVADLLHRAEIDRRIADRKSRIEVDGIIGETAKDYEARRKQEDADRAAVDEAINRSAEEYRPVEDARAVEGIIGDTADAGKLADSLREAQRKADAADVERLIDETRRPDDPEAPPSAGDGPGGPEPTGGGDVYLGSIFGGAQGAVSGAARRASGWFGSRKEQLRKTADEFKQSGLRGWDEWTNKIADLANGRSTVDEWLDWAEANQRKVAGAVNEQALARARDNLLLENAERASRGEREIEITDGSVYWRALKDAAPADARLAADLGEVSGVKARHTLDYRRHAQAADGGKLDGPVQRWYQRMRELVEMADVAAANEIAGEFQEAIGRHGVERGSAESRAAGIILHTIRGQKGATPSDALSNLKVQDALAETANPRAAIDFATEIQGLMLKNWTRRDRARRLFVGRGMGKIEGGYVPQVRRGSRLVDVRTTEQAKDWLLEFTEPKKQRDPSPFDGQSEFAKFSPSEILSGRNRHRTESIPESKLEMDLVKLVENYANDTSSSIVNQAGLSVGKSIEAYFKSRAMSLQSEINRAIKDNRPDSEIEGLREQQANLVTTSDTMGKLNQLSYNDINWGVLKSIQDSVRGTRPGAAAYKLAAINKQVFNRARYTLNVPFMVLRQWTSLGLLAAFPEIKPADLVVAFHDALNPRGASGQIYANTYTGRAKGLGVGQMYSEGANAALSRGVKIGRGKGARAVAKADQIAGMPTGAVESFTGRYAVAVGEMIASRLGLTGRVRQDFLSDIVAKTQSE